MEVKGRLVPAVPSGPSAYIFDRSGRLVEWCWDIGDNSAFDDKWAAQRSNGSSPVLLPSQVDTWVTPASRPAG